VETRSGIPRAFAPIRRASEADLAVTVLGVAGLLGFLMAGRMDDVNASPFDIFAFVWFLRSPLSS
jgi:hypothetical protein